MVPVSTCTNEQDILRQGAIMHLKLGRLSTSIWEEEFNFVPACICQLFVTNERHKTSYLPGKEVCFDGLMIRSGGLIAFVSAEGGGIDTEWSTIRKLDKTSRREKGAGRFSHSFCLGRLAP